MFFGLNGTTVAITLFVFSVMSVDGVGKNLDFHQLLFVKKNCRLKICFFLSEVAFGRGNGVI